MDAHVDTITHRVRSSILERETIWRLLPDAIEREQVLKDGKDLTVRYPYGDIREIRLSFAPTRVDRARYRCDFQLKNGTLVAILSTHYAGFADFEDRGATYAPLVRGLIERVAQPIRPASSRLASGPAPIGASTSSWASDAAAVGVRDWRGRRREPVTLVLMRLGILTFIIPVMILYTRKNWPRSFDPGDPGRADTRQQRQELRRNYTAVRKRSTAASSTPIPSPGPAGSATAPSRSPASPGRCPRPDRNA